MKYIENITFSKSISEHLKNNLDRCIHNVLNIVDVGVKDPQVKARLRKVVLDEFNYYHREAEYVCIKVQEIADAKANKNQKD